MKVTVGIFEEVRDNQPTGGLYRSALYQFGKGGKNLGYLLPPGREWKKVGEKVIFAGEKRKTDRWLKKKLS